MIHQVWLASVLFVQYPIHDPAGLVGVNVMCAVFHIRYTRFGWRHCYVCSIPCMIQRVRLPSVLCVCAVYHT